MGVKGGSAGPKTGVWGPQQGVRLRHKLEGVRHRASSDAVAGGGKLAITYSASENLEPGDCMIALGEVGVQAMLLTEAEPKVAVSGGGGGPAEREAGSHRCFNSADITQELRAGCRCKRVHGWAKGIQGKCESTPGSQRSGRCSTGGCRAPGRRSGHGCHKAQGGRRSTGGCGAQRRWDGNGSHGIPATRGVEGPRGCGVVRWTVVYGEGRFREVNGGRGQPMPRASSGVVPHVAGHWPSQFFLLM